MQTRVDDMAQKLSRGVLIAGMATAIVAGSVAMVNGGLEANAKDGLAPTSVETTISVTVDAVNVNITQINGITFDNNDEAGKSAIVTYNAKNEIHFKTDEDAHVRIMLGSKVLWEGDTKAGQPTTATIDITGNEVGVYNLQIRATKPGDDLDKYSVAFFHLDYRATVPSIIPNVPNTGMYVTMGGRVYSMTTIATVALLIAIVALLVSSKGRAQAATAKATTKKRTNRKKMDLI